MQRLQLNQDNAFGEHLRSARERRAQIDPAYSLRQVAVRCEITPAYLSRVERGEVSPPGEEAVKRLAQDLGEDPDVLLALAGKVSDDLRAAILARPRLFADLIRTVREMPDHAVLRIVREVHDGEW